MGGVCGLACGRCGCSLPLRAAKWRTRRAGLPVRGAVLGGCKLNLAHNARPDRLAAAKPRAARTHQVKRRPKHCDLILYRRRRRRAREWAAFVKLVKVGRRRVLADCVAVCRHCVCAARLRAPLPPLPPLLAGRVDALEGGRPAKSPTTSWSRFLEACAQGRNPCDGPDAPGGAAPAACLAAAMAASSLACSSLQAQPANTIVPTSCTGPVTTLTHNSSQILCLICKRAVLS